MHGEGALYRFDEFELDLARATLRRRDGGLIELRPKAFALLVHLTENPGRLHTRQQLLDTLWPGLAVTDDSLTQCVSDLRRGFADRAAEVLRTIPRRGYILNATVQRLDPVPLAALPPMHPPILAHSNREALWGARTACVMVQPLEHPANDFASLYLSSTVSSDLASELSLFEDLSVHLAASTLTGAAYRIAGEVRPAGPVLRVTVRLFTASGVALFAERLELPATDLPELGPSEMLKLARTLVLQVNTEDRRRARLTPNAERTARQHCLLAQEHHQRATEQDTLTARGHLESAVALDPDFAPAYAWLCFVVQRAYTQGWGEMDSQTARDTALSLARRAVQLEPASPLCLARLGYVLMLHGRHEEAIATADDALRSHRRLTWESAATAAETLGCCARHEPAIEVLRAALAQDTHCAPTVHAILGRSLALAGEQEAALAELQLCRSRVPAYLPCLLTIVLAAAETGQMAAAVNAYADLRHYHPWWTKETERGHWVVRLPEEDARFWQAFAQTEAFAAATATPPPRSTAGGLLN